MPERLASWGCDEKLWEAVKDKRAIVRLANTAGGEVRCRRRLENLRKLVEAAEADKRAVERAARRAARKASDAKDAAVIAAVAAEEAAARRAARRAARQQTAATATEEEAEEAEKEGDEAIPWLLQEPQEGSRIKKWLKRREKKYPKVEREDLPPLELRREWQTEEHRQAIPPQLVEWGCDEALWSVVKNKNALRRLARDGDEEHGRRRIANLREKLLAEVESA